MARKRVVVIEGEDAAPEAMRPSVALLKRLDLAIDWLDPPAIPVSSPQRPVPTAE